MTDRFCPLVADSLPLYADGQLSPGAAAAVAEHLEQCPECAALYRKMMRGEFEVGTTPEPPGAMTGHPRWEAGVLRKLGRRLLAVLLVAALAWGAVGVYSYILARQAGQRALANAFYTLARDVEMRLTQAAMAFEAIAAQLATLEPQALGSTIEYLYEAGDGLRLLGLLDAALHGEPGDPAAAYTRQVEDACDYLRQCLAFDALAGRMNSRDAGPLDVEFATAAARSLGRLAEAVALGPGSHGGTRPVIEFDEGRREGAVSLARDLTESCRLYRQEAALQPGTHPASIDTEGAIAAAREGMEKYAQFSRLTPQELEGLLAAGVAEEFIDAWRGLHYWRVTFGPAERPSEQAEAMVDARSGELLGWLWPGPGTRLPAGLQPPPTPATPGDDDVTAVEASGAAAGFLASAAAGGYGSDAEYVLLGASFHRRWIVVITPRRGVMTNYADPVVVTVDAKLGSVIGACRLTRTSETGWNPQVGAEAAAEEGGRRIASILGMAGAPRVTVFPSLYRMEWGGVRAAWCVETPESPLSGLKVFIDAATGRYLGVHGTGRRTGPEFSYSEYVSWGFRR